jgi:hypothetical protein
VFVVRGACHLCNSSGARPVLLVKGRLEALALVCGRVDGRLASDVILMNVGDIHDENQKGKSSTLSTKVLLWHDFTE